MSTNFKPLQNRVAKYTDAAAELIKLRAVHQDLLAERRRLADEAKTLSASDFLTVPPGRPGFSPAATVRIADSESVEQKLRIIPDVLNRKMAEVDTLSGEIRGLCQTIIRDAGRAARAKTVELHDRMTKELLPVCGYDKHHTMLAARAVVFHSAATDWVECFDQFDQLTDLAAHAAHVMDTVARFESGEPRKRGDIRPNHRNTRLISN